VQENAENKQKTRTGIAFRLVAKCLYCGLSSFGADQSNCPPLLECQPAMGDMDGRPGIGQIGIDPDQQVQVVSERSQDNLNPGESLQQSTSTA